MTRITVTITIMTLLIAAAAIAQKTPVELGDVRWERDLDVAVERARTTGRDVFVLFQEVPG